MAVARGPERQIVEAGALERKYTDGLSFKTQLAPDVSTQTTIVTNREGNQWALTSHSPLAMGCFLLEVRAPHCTLLVSCLP